MGSKRIFKLTALCAALALAWGPALGQEEPSAAELSKPESVVLVGLGYWTDDRPRLGVYDGMQEKGPYFLLDALISRRDDATGTWFTLDARNLGLDSREFRAEWLRQGDIGVSIEYNQIPYASPYTVMTATQGLGTSMQRTPTPSATSLGEWQAGTMREGWSAGFYKSLGGGTDFRVSLKNEHKEGSRLWGRGGAPEFAAEPIDSDTRQLEAVVSHAGKAFQIQAGYYGSSYTNRNSLVDTANINAAGTTLTNPFYLSLPLDNQAHQLYVNGGYNFTERTRGTFKVAYTRATQDEDIPVGTGVAVFSGAPTHLDGRLDTTLAQLGVSSRATSNLSWLASLRYYNADEKTPQYRVVQPAGGCGTCVDTTPLAFKTLSGKLEGTYRLTAGTSLIGGFEYADQDRRVPVGNLNAAGVDQQRYVPWRVELQELTYYVQGRRSLSETLNGSIRYGHSRRDGPDFTLTNEAQSDLINPIHIADRDRDKFRLMLDWSPLQALTLTFNAEYARDEYGHSDARPYGLLEGSATLYSIDAAYSISENWQVSAWYSRDNAKATQLGQRNANAGVATAEAVKEANLEDIGDTFGAGLKGTIAPRLKGGVDLLLSKNVNKYPETITPTGAGGVFPVTGGVTTVPLPDIQNKMTRLKLYASYALQKQTEVRFDYWYDRWQTDDWSWLFANGSTFTYGTTTDGTQVLQAPKQSANFFGVRYISRFQ
jgi:MtrB/PioB family decaheme-associated outer membrane protein